MSKKEALYQYEAISKDGKLSTGSLSGTGDRDIVIQLQRKGLTPISITSGSAAPAKSAEKKAAKPRVSSSGLKLGSFPRMSKIGSAKELITFTDNLSVLISAGVSLDRALGILVEMNKPGKFKNVVRDILARIREGSGLGEAIAAYPSLFSRVYVGMVKAGESGGILDAVLKKLSQYLVSAQEIREYLVSAMIYPAILTLTSGLSMVVLLTFVIPKFADIFSGMGVALPTPTKVLLGVGNFFSAYWWLVLALIGLIIFAFKSANSTERGRYFLDGVKFRLPVAGDVMIKIEVSRMSSTLGTLLSNGVPILQAMKMATEATSNTVFKGCLKTTYDDLKQGELLSASLGKIPFYPNQAVHMIGVGEETGRLDEMLIKVAEIYEKELKASIKSLTSLIEPLIILIMGLMIGAMVVSMLMAIFSINDVDF